jgi:hypothetical protein
MKRYLKPAWVLLSLAVILLTPAAGRARCVIPAPSPRCEPLIGLKTAGLRIEVRDSATGLGISEDTLRGLALETVQRLLPKLRIEENSNRSPQIRILVKGMGTNGLSRSIYLQTEVRGIEVQKGRLRWKPAWVKSFVVPASTENVDSEVESTLKDIFHRLAADWGRENPGLASGGVFSKN